MHKLLESNKKKQQRQNAEQYRRAHMSLMIESRRYAEEANVSHSSHTAEPTTQTEGTHNHDHPDTGASTTTTSSTANNDNRNAQQHGNGDDENSEPEVNADDFSLLRKQLEDFDRHGTVPEDIVPKLNLSAENLSPQRKEREKSSKLARDRPRFSLRLRLPNFKKHCNNNGSQSHRVTPNRDINGGNSRAKRLSIAVRNFFTPAKKSTSTSSAAALNNLDSLGGGRRRAVSNVPARHMRHDPPDIVKRSPRFREDPDELSTFSDTSLFATGFRDDDTLMSEIMDTDVPSDDEDEDELEVTGAPGSAEHDLALNFIERHITSGNTHHMSPRDNVSPRASPLRKNNAAHMLLSSPRRRKAPKEIMQERHKTVMKMLRETYAKKSSEKIISLELKRLKELSSFSPSIIMQSLQREEKLHPNYVKVNQYFAKKKGGPLEKAILL